MSLIAQLKEKRNHIAAQASLLVKPEMTAETRAKIDAMFADADALKGDIDRAERAEALEAEMRSVKPLPASPIGAQNEVAGEPGVDPLTARLASAEYKSAYKKYLRHGDRELSQSESRTLKAGFAESRTQSSASMASGGYIVPIDLADQINVALKYYGGMRSSASVFRTAGGGVLNWPTNNDTTNVGAILSGTAPEQDLTFGSVPFGAWTYTTKQIPVQAELLEDSAFDLDSYIRDAFVTRIGRIQNTHFTVGTGSGQPNGVVTAATVGVPAATGGSTSITYNNLVDLIHSVDIAYRPNAKYMFNDLTLAAIRKLTDNYGRPLLGLGINGGDPDSILGYRYVVNNDVTPMAASAPSALFGDFSKYKIRDVANSLSIMRLTELGALQNQVIYVGFVRADGQMIDAGTHPIKTFVNSAT